MSLLITYTWAFDLHFLPAPLHSSVLPLPAVHRHAAQMADEFDDLLDDFGRRPSILKRLVYVFLSLEPVLVTAVLFVRIFLVSTSASQVTLLFGALLSAVLLSLSYHNLAFAKSARLRRTASPPTKGAYKGDKEGYTKAMAKFEASISDAALWYSFAYNNAIFMIVTPLLGMYLLPDKVAGDLNLLLSGAAAAALALFNSNTALKAIGE